MILQKIISIILVVCLLAALTTSASAVDIYSTTPEAEPLLKSPVLMSTYSGGISTAAVEPSDLSTYLSAVYNGYSQTVAQLLATLNTSFNQFLKGSGSIPNGVGGTTNGSNVSLWQLNNEGFQGITYVLTQIRGYVSNLNDYTSLLNSILTSVNNVVTGLSTVNASVISAKSVLEAIFPLLYQPSGYQFLDLNGNISFSGSANPISNVLAHGLMGLDSTLKNNLILSNTFYPLLADGTSGAVSGPMSITRVLFEGFRGLSSNIKGSEGDNIYISTLNDNNNTTTTVNSTGLGPLLNTQLSNIGENLGHLAYVFASDDEIKLKQNSEPIMEEVGSIYDDSDSKVKVNADGIGGVKNVVGEFGDFLEVDAGMDDLITIVTNSQSYSWLTQATLNNLDSVGVTTYSRGESWHDKLYNEFYAEYFPERE